MSVTWTITKDTATNTMRFEATGVIPIDLNQTVIGDYVNVFGSGFDIDNRGSWEITNVEVYYVAGTLHQAFEFINQIGVAESAIQTSNDDLQFFRPTITTTQTNDGRTVVVSSTNEGILDVVIPATSQAVSRGLLTGSYLHENDSLAINRIVRDDDGAVTVYYDGVANPTLAVGNQVFIDNVNQTPFEQFKSTGTIAAWPATSTTDASNVDLISSLQAYDVADDPGRSDFTVLKAVNGDGLIIGGHRKVASVASASNVIGRFRPVSTALVADGTLAEGSTRHTYQWPAVGTSGASDASRAVNITSGPGIDKVLIFGGASLTLGNWHAVQAIATNTTFKYDPVANSTGSGSSTDPTGTAGHSLTVLPDGRILTYGGANSVAGIFTNTNNYFGYLWNPTTQAWSTVADMVSDFYYGRAYHTATVLQDDTVLLAGGLAGAWPTVFDANTLAYWPCNDTGATIFEINGTYDLTVSGTVGNVPGAKIVGGREFTQLGSASGAGDAGVVTALLGEWTVEWWSCGATGVYPGTMALNGLGAGTVLAYGGTSDLEVDNTLMQVGINAGNLFWKWENGAGVDVTASYAITGALTNRFNHFAVRKSYNGVTYDVDAFVNGKNIGSTTGQANATGGGSSLWYMAEDPDGSAGFSGVLNEVRISKTARTDQEILLNFFTGSSSLNLAAGGLTHRIGPLREECEIWDGSDPTPTVVGSMLLPRAYHTATLLSDGRVLMVGGLAYNATNFTDKLAASAATSLLGPSESTNFCEIYDPTTGKFDKGPVLNIRRYKHAVVEVPSRNQLFIIGGESTQGDDCKVIEVLDLTTFKSTVFAQKLTHQISGAVLMNDSTILCVTNELSGGAYLNTHELIVLDSPSINSGGFNNTHRVTGIGSGYFTISTPENRSWFSNYGKPDKTTTYNIASAARTSNVTTLTFATAGHGFAVGDSVFVNFQAAPAQFTSGRKTVTAIGASTISYAETAANQGSLAEAGEVYKNYSTEAIVAPVGALADSTVPGPFILDPVNGVAVTSVKDTIGGSLFTGIYKNQKYTILPVDDATVFPDEEGFIVIGFGLDIQTLPIKYYGRYNPYGLLIDYNYQFVNDIPEDTEVTLLSSRDPYEPDHLIGGLYGTASSAGRIAAQKTITEITAAGVDLDFTIVYPGGQGLGGEGMPVSNAKKLSDVTSVFAGDDVDNEVKNLKEGN